MIVPFTGQPCRFHGSLEEYQEPPTSHQRRRLQRGIFGIRFESNPAVTESLFGTPQNPFTDYTISNTTPENPFQIGSTNIGNTRNDNVSNNPFRTTPENNSRTLFGFPRPPTHRIAILPALASSASIFGLASEQPRNPFADPPPGSRENYNPFVNIFGGTPDRASSPLPRTPVPLSGFFVQRCSSPSRTR